MTASLNTSYGVYLYGNNDAVISGTGNLISLGGYGLYLNARGDAGLTLTGTVVTGSQTGVNIDAANDAVVTLDGATDISASTVRAMFITATDGPAISVDGATIHDNLVSSNGAGAYVSAFGNAYVEFIDSTFEGNQTTGFGGGIYIGDLTGPAATVEITGTTITGNSASQSGGGVALFQLIGVDAALAISGSRILGNTTLGNGAGIWAQTLGGATSTEGLSIEDSTIDGNDAPSGDAVGGGIYVQSMQSADTDDPILTIRRSTISRNTAEDGGGGGLWLQAYPGPSLTIIDSSTISGNEVDGIASGLFFAGTGNASTTVLRILHSTIADNASDDGFESVRLFDTTLELAYTIVTTRDGDLDVLVGGPGDDSAVDAVYSTFEFLPPALEPLFAGDHVRFGIDPKLGPLQDNGGPTETALAAGGLPRDRHRRSGVHATAFDRPARRPACREHHRHRRSRGGGDASRDRWRAERWMGSAGDPAARAGRGGGRGPPVRGSLNRVVVPRPVDRRYAALMRERFSGTVAVVVLAVGLVGLAPLSAAAAPQTFHVTVDGGTSARSTRFPGPSSRRTSTGTPVRRTSSTSPGTPAPPSRSRGCRRSRRICSSMAPVATCCRSRH